MRSMRLESSSKSESLILPTRRGFIGFLGGLLAAPAVVKFTSLMPISVPRETFEGFVPIEWSLLDPAVWTPGELAKHALQSQELAELYPECRTMFCPLDRLQEFRPRAEANRKWDRGPNFFQPSGPATGIIGWT